MVITAIVLVIIFAYPMLASASGPFIFFNDINQDRVYFNNDYMDFTLSGFNDLLNGRNVRAAFVVFPDPGNYEYYQNERVLAELTSLGGYFFTTTKVENNSFRVSGTINDPDQELPFGTVGILISFQMTGGTWNKWAGPVPLIPSDEVKYPAIVGLNIPGDTFFVEPGLSDFKNLYDSEQTIKFTKPNTGSVSFMPGLNFVANQHELSLIQDSIRIDYLDGSYQVQVDTAKLSFLSNHVAIISLYKVLQRFNCDQINADNLLASIKFTVKDKDGHWVSDADLHKFIDTDLMIYDEVSDNLIIPVKHFTSFFISAEASPEKGNSTYGIGLYCQEDGKLRLRTTLDGGIADQTIRYGPKYNNWIPLTADWNGDGFFGQALYNPSAGLFYLKNILSGGAADQVIRYGRRSNNWLPVAGDWNGDGLYGPGLYDKVSGNFYLKNETKPGRADYTFRYGPRNNKWYPLTGDWNGDGIYGVALYSQNSAVFYVRETPDTGKADYTFRFGPRGNNWLPLAGDWNGDGKYGVALYDQANSIFYLKNYLSSGPADISFRFGPKYNNWLPVACKLP